MPQECIIVCIVSLEDISVNPHNVPYSQCREIRLFLYITDKLENILVLTFWTILIVT